MINISKTLKGIGIIVIVILFIKAFLAFILFCEQSQKMNNLNYEVTLNDDGSMKVVETWDIFISHTNTLFKNFNKSSNFGEITDVSVKDLKTGEELKQIYEEMYHVTTGCFYALNIPGDMFEIAWGTGMENGMGKKKYQITYTVTNVATEYKDCQELYWMFLSNTNEIPVNRATGTITLPRSVENIENLKVWGHGPLNGNIERKAENNVAFSIYNLSSGSMLEVRVITKNKIMKSIDASKIKDYNYLSNILSEETGWANEANEKARIWKNVRNVFMTIYAVILIFQVFRIYKYYKLAKKKDDGINKNKLEYYRDIPRDGNSTPMEAAYMFYFNKSLERTKNAQSDVVAANILNLALKKYISLRCEEKLIYVKILKSDDGLKNDEKAIYKLLKNTGKKDEFEIGELNTYAKKHYSEYSVLINRMVNEARETLYKERLVDKGEKRLYEKSKSAKEKFDLLKTLSAFVILWILISMLPIINAVSIIQPLTLLKIALWLAPLVITSLVKSKIMSKIQSKIAVLTQEGYEEKTQWQALGMFLLDYSMLEEATTPSLAIWEKYLVFATAFDIADKVIEEMKAKYPEVFVEEYWADEKREQYPVLNFSLYSGIHYHDSITINPISYMSSSASTAYHTSVREIDAHTSSSGGGDGGGFSGGGGGRRRRWPEWEEDNPLGPMTQKGLSPMGP